MSVNRLAHMYGTDGRMILETYAIYAAFAPLDEKTTLLKVGMSVEPLDRIYAVHCGSPFAVKKALWMYVGRKQIARKVEAAAHRRLASKRTRGEWFRMEMDNPEDKELFHQSMRFAICRLARMPVKWNVVDISTVIEAKSIRWRDQRA